MSHVRPCCPNRMIDTQTRNEFFIHSLLFTGSVFDCTTILLHDEEKKLVWIWDHVCSLLSADFAVSSVVIPMTFLIRTLETRTLIVSSPHRCWEQTV
eukprot:UN18099